MKKYRITVNGNEYDVEVEELAEGMAASSAPKAAPKQAPKKETPKQATGAGSVKISSPMPGKIVQVKSSQGVAIKKGQVILILEAMKMENEIVAPQDGTIASINVTVGQTVEAGELLASLN